MFETIPLFEASELSRSFGQGKKKIMALDAVTFSIFAGEVVSIVGESGSGKTTLAQLLLQLQPFSAGSLLFKGRKLLPRKEYWRSVQMVFQNPYAAFNQFYKITAQLTDSFNLLKSKQAPNRIRDLVDEALRMVAIEPEEVKEKYPFELSGGQMQRLLLARIFLIKPEVLIADEPTSMIDACSRQSILECLLSLKRKLGMTILFITHDIGLASKISDRLLVVHRGKIIEQGAVQQILHSPREEYTKKLLDHTLRLKAPEPCNKGTEP